MSATGEIKSNYVIWCKVLANKIGSNKLAFEMRKAFPCELILCHGVRYNGTDEIYTSWCENKDGTVIDPSAIIEDAIDKYKYRKFNHKTQALFRCLYCGGYYSNADALWSPCCSEECLSRL